MKTNNNCVAVDKLCEVFGINKEYLAVALGTNIRCLERFLSDDMTTYKDLRYLFRMAQVDVTVRIRNFWKTPNPGEPVMQFLRNYFEFNKIKSVGDDASGTYIEKGKPEIWWRLDDISLKDLEKVRRYFKLELGWTFSGIGENDEEIINEKGGRLVGSVRNLSWKGMNSNFKDIHDNNYKHITEGGWLEFYEPSGKAIEEALANADEEKIGTTDNIFWPGESTTDIPAEDPETETDSVTDGQEFENGKKAKKFGVYPEFRDKIKELAIRKYGNRRSTSKLVMDVLNELPSNMAEEDFQKIFSKENITWKRNKEDCVECTIRVDEEENKQLESIAKKTDLSTNEVLICLILDYFKKIDVNGFDAIPAEAEDTRETPETTPVETVKTVPPEETQTDFETENLEPLPPLPENWDNEIPENVDDKEIPEQQPIATQNMKAMTPSDWLKQVLPEVRKILDDILEETGTKDYLDGRYGGDTLYALRPLNYPADEKMMMLAGIFKEAVRDGEITIKREKLQEPSYQTASLINLNSTRVEAYVLMTDILDNLLSSYGKTTLTLDEKMTTVGKNPFEFSSVTVFTDEDGKQVLRFVNTKKKLFGEKAVTMDASPDKLSLQDWYTLAEAAEKHCSEVGRIHIAKTVNRTDMEVTELKRTYNEKMLSALKTLITDTYKTGLLKHFYFFYNPDDKDKYMRDPFAADGKVFFYLDDEREKTINVDDIEPFIVPDIVHELLEHIKKKI